MNDILQSNLIELLKVLSQEIRINILRILIQKGPLTFSELNSLLDIKHNSKLSFHLGKLKEMNLVAVKSGGEYVITEYGKKVYSKLNELLLESGLVRTVIIYNFKGIPHILSREELVKYLRNYNLTRGKIRDILNEIDTIIKESGIYEIYQDELFGLVYFTLFRKGIFPQNRSDTLFINIREFLQEDSLSLTEKFRDIYIIRQRMSRILKEFISEGYFYIWHPYYLYNGYSAILYKPEVNEKYSFSYFLKNFYKLRERIGEHIVDSFSLLIKEKNMRINDIKEAIELLNELATKNYKLSLIIESPEIINKKHESEQILKNTYSIFEVLAKETFPNILFIVRIDKEDYRNKKIMSSILRMISNGQSVIIDLFPDRKTLITSNLFKIRYFDDNKIELLRYAIGINMPIMLIKSIQRKIDFLDILEDVLNLIKDFDNLSISNEIINALKESLNILPSNIDYQANIAFTGFHFALKMHHRYLEIKELNTLTNRFWSEIKENYSNNNVSVTSGIVCEELYEQLNTIKQFNKKLLGNAKIYDYNSVSPFSFYEDYDIDKRIEIEKVFQSIIDSGDIFNLHLSPSSILSGSFLSNLFSKLRDNNIRWITITYELSKCLSCYRTFRGINLICPSCLSTNILNLIRPFTSYIDKNKVSPFVDAEYSKRKRYSIRDIKKYLLS